MNQQFTLWKCPTCQSIRSLQPVDYAQMYSDYPLNRRRLDVFAKGTLSNLLRRLVKSGLAKTDAVLDYGCGNGLFIDFLKARGYSHVTGYDPFVTHFSSLDPEQRFDCVIANDVIEHVDDPRVIISACARLCRPGGLLYIGTSDSAPVDMSNLEPEIMRLHQPFHRLMMTQQTLEKLAREAGLEVVKSYRRSYMDTWLPFSNYRFLDELNGVLGNNLDRAFEPAAGAAVGRHPSLWFYGFFGYLMPSAFEPAVVLRKPAKG